MKRLLFLSLLVTAALCFASLGIWQLERRVWKLELIERVNERSHADAAPAPSRSRWEDLETYEYRRVKLSGTFDHEKTVLVDALTKLGAGAWVITPLRTRDGTVLVNRGFIPLGKGDYDRPTDIMNVVGLLRLTEPYGRFLRPNKPDANLWYSRDIGAIARARGVPNPAPYFVDAQADPSTNYPVGGLTVVNFRNAHLFYALTWFCLTAIALFGAWRINNAS